MALLDWEKLPVSVRRSRQKLYKHIQDNMSSGGGSGNEETDELLTTFGTGDHEIHLIFQNEDGTPFQGYASNPNDMSNKFVKIDNELIIRYYPQLLDSSNIEDLIYYTIWDSDFQKNTSLRIEGSNDHIQWDSNLTVVTATQGELVEGVWDFGAIEDLPESITVTVTVGEDTLSPVNSVIVKAGYTDESSGYVATEDIVIPLTKDRGYCSFSNNSKTYVFGTGDSSAINVSKISEIPDGIYSLEISYSIENKIPLQSVSYSNTYFNKKGAYLDAIIITEPLNDNGINQEVTFNSQE